MSTLATHAPSSTTTTPSQRLRAAMAAVRVSFVWLGVRKTLNPQQKAQAAESFGAAGDYLSAGKKLLDTRHPAFKGVTAIRSRAVSYWKGISLPYPEPGIRLVRQEDLAAFDVQLTTLKAELAEAVEGLERRYGELQTAARQRLGSLFNPADYPESLHNLFAIEWDFPSIDPPSYLRQLSPELFEQEQTRIAARFDEAVRLAEEAFTGELSKLVTHLAERLTGDEDGRPKIFRDSAIENLGEFFDRFRHLNIRSNEQLDELVERARRVVRGVEPQQLRDNQGLRQQVAGQLVGVQSVLDGLMIDRPRRRIIRSGVQRESA